MRPKIAFIRICPKQFAGVYLLSKLRQLNLKCTRSDQAEGPDPLEETQERVPELLLVDQHAILHNKQEQNSTASEILTREHPSILL